MINEQKPITSATRAAAVGFGVQVLGIDRKSPAIRPCV